MVKGIIYNPNVEDPAKEQSGYMERLWAVSYTHLTLPTICSV